MHMGRYLAVKTARLTGTGKELKEGEGEAISHCDTPLRQQPDTSIARFETKKRDANRGMTWVHRSLADAFPLLQVSSSCIPGATRQHPSLAFVVIFG